MPSVRRLRMFGLLVFAFVIYVLHLTSSTRSASSDFYTRTKDALDNSHRSDHRGGTDHIAPSRQKRPADDDEALAVAMSERLRDAEVAAKDSANAKAPTRESVMGDEERGEVGNGKPVTVERKGHDVMGQKPVAEEDPSKKGSGSTSGNWKDRNVAGRKKYPLGDEEEKAPEKTDEEKDVEAEMNRILKMSPIIIFSKSYCPHSTRAKGILLEKYSIIPAPHVVELDQHPLGRQLQARLAKMTGRTTVPNVLIKGKSIGGGDDVAELDTRRTLIDKVRAMAGKQMQKVQMRDGSGAAGL